MLKKVISAILAAIVLTGIFTGCSTRSEENESSVDLPTSEAVANESNDGSSEHGADNAELSEPDEKGVDRTLKFNGFDPNAYPWVQNAYGMPSLSGEYYNIDYLWDGAENIVYGTVDEIRYFDELEFAALFCNFRVENVYKGGLSEGDVITYKAPGGYMRLEQKIKRDGNGHFEDWTEEEIKNTVFLYMFEGCALPEIGDKYLLFLYGEENYNPECLEGVYYRQLGLFMGRYYYNAEGRLERSNPEGGYYYITPERRQELYEQYGTNNSMYWTEEDCSDPTYSFEEVDALLKWMAIPDADKPERPTAEHKPNKPKTNTYTPDDWDYEGSSIYSRDDVPDDESSAYSTD